MKDKSKKSTYSTTFGVDPKNYRFSVRFAPIAVKGGKNDKARKSFVYTDGGLFLNEVPDQGLEP